MNEEEPCIRNIIRDNLYDYKYLLYEYEYNVFVETVVDEINKQINENKK